MKITLFGGAFDPPHCGHLRIAQELLRRSIADEVWFVPVKYHAFEKEMQSDEDRLAMISAMLEPRMRVETFELQQESTSYTYKTLSLLAGQHPEHIFSFVIGSDNLARFDTWDKLEHLVEEFRFYVYPRTGYPLTPLQKNMKVLEGVPEVDVSSTEVRADVQAGESITGLVPEIIEQYIQEHQLYVSNSNKS